MQLLIFPLLSALMASFLSPASAFAISVLKPRTSACFSAASDTSFETDLSSKQGLIAPITVSSRVFAADKRPVILFDGVCNMCNSAVNLALDWDPQGKLRFAALQSNVGRALLQANGREADDISSIVLVTERGAYIKSDAVLKITEELTPKWIPLPVGPWQGWEDSSSQVFSET